MSRFHFSALRNVALTLGMVSALGGCASSPLPESPLDVEWFDGFTMGRFLEQPVELTTLSDVSEAIESPWYYHGEMAVYTEQGELARPAFVLGSCADYLAMKEQVWPVYEPDAGAFMVLAMMCKASQAIVTAKPAERSYMRALAFDQRLPDMLPPQLAFTISSSSVERVQQAAPGETWRDMFGIKRHESCDKRDGEHCGIYYDSTGGRQRVQLVARGDFNADGIEDVLISSHNSVEGGTYAATQMYVLTRRTADGEIEVLRELEY